jgi:hypothetical protein
MSDRFPYQGSEALPYSFGEQLSRSQVASVQRSDVLKLLQERLHGHSPRGCFVSFVMESRHFWRE